jgi:hypothetical protein
MDKELNFLDTTPREKIRRFNPKKCEHARPYMTDNGVLDIYLCKRFQGNCYYEPNGGKPFKKMCEDKRN